MPTMIGGRLNTPQILATTDPTTVYTVPADYAAVVNLSLTNRTTNTIKARVAVSTTATPNDEDWIEWETTIAPRGVFERTQITAQPARRLIVRVDTINAVAVTVYGFLNPINVTQEGDEEILVEQTGA